MKKILFLFILTLVLTHSHSAYADNTISIDGDGFFTYTETITMNFACDAYKDFVIFNPNGYALGGLICNPAESPYIYNASVQDNDSWLAEPAVLGTYTILAVDMVNPPSNNNDVCINYDETDELTGCQILFPTPVATFTLIAESGGGSSNSTWGSDNGFWGSTTPTAIIGNMTASVQTTGAVLWPLFKVIGIPIAFLLALALVGFIYQATAIPKNKENTIINPTGTDLVYHNAKDLEFIREYGQVKRKRGRPRKETL